jgi:hypothetical protein
VVVESAAYGSAVNRPKGAPIPRREAVAPTVLVAILLATACTRGDVGSEASGSASTAAPSATQASGVLVAANAEDLPPTLQPYPFATPTPAPTPSELDGTYMLILGLDDLGGSKDALPFPCVRCSPYARAPGVNTLILFEGMFFVHHQMSAFRARGNFEVEGDTIEFFNDAHCPDTRGIYTWSMEGATLRLEVIDDTCAYEGERAVDIASDPWTVVDACRREIAFLWPGILGC